MKSCEEAFCTDRIHGDFVCGRVRWGRPRTWRNLSSYGGHWHRGCKRVVWTWRVGSTPAAAGSARFRSKPRLLLPTQADSTGPIESAGETLFLAMSSNKSCPQMNQPNSPGGQRLFYTLAISSVNWLIITRRDSFRTHLTSFFSKGPKDRL